MALVRRQRAGWPDLQDLVDRRFETEGSDLLHVEEFVDDQTLVVRAEAPGIDPDKDVDIAISNGNLRIHVRREEKSEHKEKDTYRSEFRYGSFDRTVGLPPGATEDDVTATYTDGVLEIRVPVAQPTTGTPRKVPIQRT